MLEIYDYSAFSLEQLLDAQSHVNREMYPERAAEIDRWVERRSHERARSSVVASGASIVATTRNQSPTFVALVIAATLAGSIISCILAILFFRGRADDGSSKKVAIGVVKAVTRDWNPEELRKNASDEFRRAASGPTLERVFKMFRQLGGMTNLGEPTGGSRATLGIGSIRSGVTAEYVFLATFSRGDATIRVTLVRERGQWRTAGFYVNSESFLPK